MSRIIGAAVSVLLVVSVAPAEAQQLDFADIGGTTHEVSIRAVADAGVVAGYPDGSFRPDTRVTRGQMATFLANAMQLPAGGGTSPADVKGTTHEASIQALLGAGVASGFSDGTFRPRQTVTRGQMATFLANGFDFPEDDTVRFLDVLRSSHRAAITTVTGTGVASGFSDQTYRPAETVTRGQMATFFARSLNLVDRATPPADLADREAVRHSQLPRHNPITFPGFDLTRSMPVEITYPPDFDTGSSSTYGRVYEGTYDLRGDPESLCEYFVEILRYNGYSPGSMVDERGRPTDCSSLVESDEYFWVLGEVRWDDGEDWQTQRILLWRFSSTHIRIDFGLEYGNY